MKTYTDAGDEKVAVTTIVPQADVVAILQAKIDAATKQLADYQSQKEVHQQQLDMLIANEQTILDAAQVELEAVQALAPK